MKKKNQDINSNFKFENSKISDSSFKISKLKFDIQTTKLNFPRLKWEIPRLKLKFPRLKLGIQTLNLEMISPPRKLEFSIFKLKFFHNVALHFHTHHHEVNVNHFSI